MLFALCYKCVKVGLISRELPEILPALRLWRKVMTTTPRDIETKQRAPLSWRCLLAVVAIVVLSATLASRAVDVAV